jgi:hypothetical protein
VEGRRAELSRVRQAPFSFYPLQTSFLLEGEFHGELGVEWLAVSHARSGGVGELHDGVRDNGALAVDDDPGQSAIKGLCERGIPMIRAKKMERYFFQAQAIDVS